MFLIPPGFNTFIVMQRMLSIHYWYFMQKLQTFFERFVRMCSTPSKSAWLGSKYLTPLKKKKGMLKMSLLEANSRVAFLPLLFSAAAEGCFCMLDAAGTGST